MHILTLTKREVAIILAALRNAQRQPEPHSLYLEHELDSPPSLEEIDDLCETLNFDDVMV